MSIAESIVRAALKLGRAIFGGGSGKPTAKAKLDPPIIELESERLAREAEQRRNGGKPQ